MLTVRERSESYARGFTNENDALSRKARLLRMQTLDLRQVRGPDPVQTKAQLMSVREALQ
jgi:hypothetical protein